MYNQSYTQSRPSGIIKAGYTLLLQTPIRNKHYIYEIEAVFAHGCSATLNVFCSTKGFYEFIPPDPLRVDPKGVCNGLISFKDRRGFMSIALLKGNPNTNLGTFEIIGKAGEFYGYRHEPGLPLLEIFSVAAGTRMNEISPDFFAHEQQVWESTKIQRKVV